ncbi:MAG: OmpA family protein [Muribaculaceae bacterium]|nr:OmpA family protein [Muribaculaceae bacterium]
MKKNVLWSFAACSAMLLPGITANAQETVVMEEQTIIETEVPCKTQYYSTSRDNWFIQVGAGVASPFVENSGSGHGHFTANYNAAFGKYISPYLGWRVSFYGGALHNQPGTYQKFKYANANVDFMWDMFNSLGGVNTKRVFSIVPFVGLGGTFGWDYRPDGTIMGNDGKAKGNMWALPVSAGLQLNFRLGKYVDFFVEGRGQFYGDNFNNIPGGRPVDINLTVTGGLIFKIGGDDFKSYNPCDYLGYISNLNNQVNDLRGALATTSAALAAAEAQLPCPEVQETVIVQETAPLMSTVRFTLNSARISNMEMVNVYNTAEYLKANPEQKVVIVGYADKDTGSSAYNMSLSKRRAEAVKKALVDKYGISADRLTVKAEGSDSQPYSENNWNRIVIFSVAE